MKLAIIGLLAGLLGITASAAMRAPRAPQTAGTNAERVAHWREDLEFLHSKISARGHTASVKQGITTRGQIDFESEPDRVKPDILAPRPLADVLAGRDPALEAALAAN